MGASDDNWCNNCGLCCMHMRTPPFGGDADPDWQRLSKELKRELANWLDENSPRFNFMVANDGNVNPCIWLDLTSGQCRHYELRPAVCRDYEVGNSSCRVLRQEVGLTVKGMPIVKDWDGCS